MAPSNASLHKLRRGLMNASPASQVTRPEHGRTFTGARGADSLLRHHSQHWRSFSLFFMIKYLILDGSVQVSDRKTRRDQTLQAHVDPTLYSVACFIWFWDVGAIFVHWLSHLQGGHSFSFFVKANLWIFNWSSFLKTVQIFQIYFKFHFLIVSKKYELI